MEKQIKLHHSVTELGNIQVRQVTEYIDGEEIDKIYGDPYTPEDVNNLNGWDDKTKDIVAVIIKPKVKAEFEAEKQIKTGIGLEKIVTYDRVIDEEGRISVRRITRLFDDGVEVSKKYHRSWIMPGDDPKDADVISKALAKGLHTVEVVKAYKDKMAALKNK